MSMCLIGYNQSRIQQARMEWLLLSWIFHNAQE